MASSTLTQQPTATEDFKLDLSSRGVKSGGGTPINNKFDNLCDNVQSCLRTHLNALNGLYNFKDELLKHSLPSHLLLHLTLLSSQIHRNSADLSILTNELTRMVRQYSVPWEEKGMVLKKLKTDYENKQRQTNIALRQLELLAIKAEKMEHERRLNNWTKLYVKIMSANSVGRRWKFRIAPFKRKIAEGYNPYGSDDEESDTDSEDELFDQHKTSSGLGGTSDEELRELASELSQALATQQNASALKGFHQFTGFEETTLSVEGSVSPPPVPIVTVDAQTWTEEPEYNHHLLVSLYRPRDLLEGINLCCTITVGDEFFVSKAYSTNEENEKECQLFHFSLTNDIASFLSPLMEREGTANAISNEGGGELNDQWNTIKAPKISVAVFPQSIENDMIAMCSILLPNLTLLDDFKIITPPNTKDNNSEDDTTSNIWSPDWTSLSDSTADSSPARYSLKLVGTGGDELRERGHDPYILITSQWIRVIKHKVFHVGTGMAEWKELVESMGYKKECDMESRAVSAMTVISSVHSTPAIEEAVEEEEPKMSAEEMAQITMRHAEELQHLQEEYESKLESLTRDLSKMATEKQKQIEKLEEALMESALSNQQTKIMKSPSEISKMMTKKKKISFSKVDWGRKWPDDFYERLKLFSHDSLRKQAQLTEKIKREVNDTLERQLAALHRLAPLVASATAAMNDVCLPALFMPLPSSRPLVYNPRAHNYFHPPGSSDARVTQPPSVLKLPPLYGQRRGTLTTINLSEDSERYWKHVHPSPSLTPAPPPSACDHYPNTTGANNNNSTQ